MLSRMYVVLTALAVLPFIILGRLVWLQVDQGDDLREAGLRQAQSQELLLPKRGDIVDTAGRALAVNSPKYDLALDPTVPGFEAQKDDFLHRLATLTGTSSTQLHRRIDRRKSEQFVRLVNLTPEQRTEIDSWNVPGVLLEERFQRRYVYGQTAAHVLGHVDVDGIGRAGLELEYDQYLQGEPGRRTLLRDRRGYRRIDAAGIVIPPKDGETLVLTIDLIRQTIMEEELAAGVAEARAKRGSAIAVDPRSGAILAIANVPTFDPNVPLNAPVSSWRNSAITDRLEPGSSFKLIGASAALETGVTSMDRLVDTGDGELVLDGRTLHDTHPHGEISFSEVISKSSNIGMALTSELMSAEHLYRYARNYGFGQKTWIDLPGEVAGLLKRVNRWSRTTKASLTIGYEVDVTPLQMVMAYSALANGGLLRQPYVVSERRDVTGRVLWRAADDPARTDSIRRVLEPETVQTLLPALINVVNIGTATQAQTEEFTIAGKTGTARKVVRGRYGSGYRATFVGFYPAEDPQVTMIVVLDEPRTSIYGGQVAAPIFKRISERWIATFDPPTPSTPAPVPPRPLDKLVQQALAQRGPSKRSPAYTRLASERATAVRTESNARMPSASLIRTSEVMPDVIGLDARTAWFRLAADGFRVQLSGQGHVVAQSPEPGARVDTKVVLQLQ
ncbi:MAG: transpeptidase family protein [Rhodothermaceae bacterium]|nr:transpeptidase family protein [Rhodothermaceae bacterium]MYD19952.1 transpeptidase family protein [Rhodothermaceae bacterium]MYD56183.1 transpeptidase family protein [Rhodothermaceae bacterium]MYI43925.1 transpeptidase family protein [Rhodothermaceae bacterium]MYJ55647.1 transpeptidase family protein [Rhodothermaceae bacterium]